LVWCRGCGCRWALRGLPFLFALAAWAVASSPRCGKLTWQVRR